MYSWESLIKPKRNYVLVCFFTVSDEFCAGITIFCFATSEKIQIVLVIAMQNLWFILITEFRKKSLKFVFQLFHHLHLTTVGAKIKSSIYRIHRFEYTLTS